jgi:hypothetical protein
MNDPNVRGFILGSKTEPTTTQEIAVEAPYIPALPDIELPDTERPEAKPSIDHPWDHPSLLEINQKSLLLKVPDSYKIKLKFIKKYHKSISRFCTLALLREIDKEVDSLMERGFSPEPITEDQYKNRKF